MRKDFQTVSLATSLRVRRRFPILRTARRATCPSAKKVLCRHRPRCLHSATQDKASFSSITALGSSADRGNLPLMSAVFGGVCKSDPLISCALSPCVAPFK